MNEMPQFPREKLTTLETPIEYIPDLDELTFEYLDLSNMEEAKKFVGQVFAYEKQIAEDHIEKKAEIVDILPQREIGKDYRERYWIVRDENNKMIGITGFNELSGDEPDHCWLGWFALDPALRGKGLGRALLEKVETEALAAGKKELFIVTTDLPSMKGNAAFYEKEGCSVIAVIKKDTVEVKENVVSDAVLDAIQKDHGQLFAKTPKMQVYVWRKHLESIQADESNPVREQEKTL